MKKAIIVIIVLFNLSTSLSYSEETKPIPPSTQKVKSDIDTKGSPAINDSEKDKYKTLESLKEKQPWNYKKGECSSGGCNEDLPAIKEQNFSNSENKLNYIQVQKAVEEVQFPAIVTPEVPTAVRVSAQDINRVTCQAGEIRDVVYSKEKGMTVTFTGKDAYIKYKYIKRGNKTVYPNVTEMYIVCGDATYNIIAVPELIPAKTIQLSGGDQNKIKKNKKYFSGMSSEKKIMTMIRAVYTDDIAESFIVEKHQLLNISEYEELFISLARTVSAAGEGIRVKEYIIRMKEDSKKNAIEMDERDFIEMSKSPVAIAMNKLNIKKGETVRLFICEQNQGDSDKDVTPTIKINKGYINENMAPTQEVQRQDDAKSTKQYKMK